MSAALFQYTLQLADTALITGHRNSEWTGHGPILEQDIAISNIALDLVGQARYLYQYAATQFNGNPNLHSLIQSPDFQKANQPIDEDHLAYLRDDKEFYNLLIAEIPRGDWAQTVARQFFFSAYQQCLFEKLQSSTDAQLSAIAAKSLKEVQYHIRWSGEWVIRLGDGTTESQTRLQKAIAVLWPFTAEAFHASASEKELSAMAIIPSPESLEQSWTEKIAEVFQQAGIQVPIGINQQRGGKIGQHTPALGSLLAEMQILQRSYPNSEW